MRVYLASRYDRREEMLAYAADLESLGHEITARWIRGDHEAPFEINGTDDNPLWGRFAQEDADDVRRADTLIAFTEVPGHGPARGGRHVELGMALAWGKRVLVVGHHENVFTYLPVIEFYDDWGEVLEALGAEAAIERLWPQVQAKFEKAIRRHAVLAG